MTGKIRTALCICALYIMMVFLATGTSAAETIEAEYTTQTGAQQGTFEEAIAKVSDGGTVTLLADVTIDNLMTVEKSFTLSGNNVYSIKRGAATGYMIKYSIRCCYSQGYSY